MSSRLFAASALCLVFGSASADPIDAIVASQMARQQIPGVSIAVVKDGRIVKERGYGIANLEHDVPATARTVFQSGSLGKQFTAALVMLLVRDGKVRLDAPISTYLPGIPEQWAGITVRHLLNHTSGLPATDDAIDLQQDYTEDELLESAIRVPLTGTPGAQWAYSNLGYQLLGILCSKVGGAFYGDQLRARIFAPLGMQTRIISERELVPHRAAGYVFVEGRFQNQEWVSPTLNTTADGSLLLTARDLALWAIALETDRVLDHETREAMWTPARLNDGSEAAYGFGWQLHVTNGHRRIAHSGAWQGFMSYMALFPEHRLALAVLINRSQARPEDILHAIAAHYEPDVVPDPVRPPSAQTLASTPFFLRGTMNDWSMRDPMRRMDGSRYEAVVTLDAGSYEIKIGSADWRTIDFGGAATGNVLEPGSVAPLVFRGSNLMLRVPRRDTYAFRLDVTSPHLPALTVTAPAE
jgi:CubicO group peptidase (beta-lactamase class C family)